MIEAVRETAALSEIPNLLVLTSSAPALTLLMLAIDRGAALVYRHGAGSVMATGTDARQPSGTP